MPLCTRCDPASQSALVRLAELCRAESARVRRRAHLHGGGIKMVHDMQRDQWHGRREAAPWMAAACSAALHIIGQKCCDDESARMATYALGEEVQSEVRQVPMAEVRQVE